MMDDLKIDASEMCDETFERQEPPEPTIEESGEVKISIQFDKTGQGTIDIKSPGIGIRYVVDNIHTDSVRDAQEKRPRDFDLPSNWMEFEPGDTITTTICGRILPS